MRPGAVYEATAHHRRPILGTMAGICRGGDTRQQRKAAGPPRVEQAKQGTGSAATRGVMQQPNQLLRMFPPRAVSEDRI